MAATLMTMSLLSLAAQASRDVPAAAVEAYY
jgi:hypothetical protein